MGILNKFFKKQKHEISPQEMQKVENLISKTNEEKNYNEVLNEEQDSEEFVKKDYLKYLDEIKIEDINKIRNFLDQKEKEFTNLHEENIEISKQENKPEIILVGENDENKTGKIEIEKPITEKDLDEKTYTINEKEESLVEEIKFEKTTRDDEYNEVKIDDLFEKKDNLKPKSEKSSKEKFEDLLNRIKNLFGKENVLFKENQKSIYENLNYRNLNFIGVCKFDEFDNDIAHWAEQNSWFVSNLKKLEELKQFKIIESSEGFKDLLFDIDSQNSIILSFRTIDKLKDRNSFEFPILKINNIN